MSKHNSLGRLGFILSISVLGSACAVGEIGDSAGAPRLDVGFDDAALACPGVSPDVSVSDGWQSKEASQPAPDSLYFEVMARPSEANLGALVAVGAQDIHDLSDAAITVRFSENGVVDVMDEFDYSNDGFFEYDPGVWYNIAISADVNARTYDVEVGRCGEKRQNVIRGARFRTAANVYDRLSTWGVWSSRLASLQLSTPTWMASGTCAPATCEALGSECGQPGDGCNGTLNCGVCGGGQLCSSGACVDEPVSVPLPPSCTPASCQSLGAECGAPSDGCDGTLNCGLCGAGQLCSNYVCVDEPMTPPPVPPACVPTTCQTLGAECGVRSNGCGGTLNCGGCGAGQLCSDSLCIDQPVTPPPPPPSPEPAPQPAPGVTETFYATRTNCMRPCAVQLDAQKAVGLSWAEVRDSEYIWDFDDGGARTDSEGFLAAVVYETAGTYRPTVTVDGETWNVETITVTDPTEIRCVSLSGDWTGCPAGAGHYSNVGSALSGLQPSTHVLFRRGESYGSQNLGGYSNVAFGAYGSGAKPIFSYSGSWKPGSATTWMDIEYNGSNSNAPMDLMSGNDILLFRMTLNAFNSNKGLYAEDGYFIIESEVTGGQYGIYTYSSPYLVVKDSTLDRAISGEHTFRIQSGNRSLIQNNQILHSTGDGYKTAFQLRGYSDWALVQNNYADQMMGVQPQNDLDGYGELQRYVVWERNTLDSTNASIGWGMRFVGHDMIVRNNVTFNSSQFQFKAETYAGITATNIWFINNTAFTNKGGSDGFVCGGTGCVSKNNLFYSPHSVSSCFSGGTQAKNWCRTSNICLDPITGNSSCYDPTFVSTDPSSPDFVQPAAGARGIDGGDPNVPIWDDLHNVDRTAIDVGAAER